MPDDDLHPWTRVAARAGSIALIGGITPLVVIGVASAVGVLDPLPPALRRSLGLLSLVVLPLFLFGLAAVYLPRPGRHEPRAVAAPIRGRCQAVNSPASKVPSHGMHLFAQTYAIDLVHEPAPGERPTFGGWRPMRQTDEYPSFGQPVHAPADGEVVAAHDRRRDHRCRSNLLGYLYMLVEGLVLQLRGPRGLMGNHLVLRLDDGGYVALAHLQQGSIRPAVGDRVHVGQIVAKVGNSGNTSEPHVHLQVMDHPRPARAAGLPFVFTDVVVSGDLDAPDTAPQELVPEDGTVFHAGSRAEPQAGA